MAVIAHCGMIAFRARSGRFLTVATAVPAFPPPCHTARPDTRRGTQLRILPLPRASWLWPLPGTTPVSWRSVLERWSPDAGELRRSLAGPPPVRLHRFLSFHFSGVLHRSCELSRRARRPVAEDGSYRLPHSLPVLAQDLRAHVRHGCGLRDRADVSVRYELVRVLAHDGTRDRPAHGVRSDDGVLSRSRLPRRHALWAETSRAAFALRRNARGGLRHPPLGLLDPVGE